jgi:hypothetical protein
MLVLGSPKALENKQISEAAKIKQSIKKENMQENEVMQCIISLKKRFEMRFSGTHINKDKWCKELIDCKPSDITKAVTIVVCSYLNSPSINEFKLLLRGLK